MPRSRSPARILRITSLARWNHTSRLSTCARAGRSAPQSDNGGKGFVPAMWRGWQGRGGSQRPLRAAAAGRVRGPRARRGAAAGAGPAAAARWGVARGIYATWRCAACARRAAGRVQGAHVGHVGDVLALVHFAHGHLAVLRAEKQSKCGHRTSAPRSSPSTRSQPRQRRHARSAAPASAPPSGPWTGCQGAAHAPRFPEQAAAGLGKQGSRTTAAHA